MTDPLLDRDFIIKAFRILGDRLARRGVVADIYVFGGAAMALAYDVVGVNDVLDGRVGLDVECLDRIYLNGWVPTLQVPGQVVNFLTHHLGFPIPSPAILEKIGLRFRKAVSLFARDNGIEVVRFGGGERKLEVMRPASGPVGPGGRERGGGDRGGAGVSAGVHRHYLLSRRWGWWCSAVRVCQGRSSGDGVLLLPGR